MFKQLLRSFSDELMKIAAITPEKAFYRVDEHHHSVEKKDWEKFEKGLKTKTFQQAVLKHPDSDAKLKKYVKTYGGYLNSKDVVGVVPSRTSSKLYKVKKLQDGRLGCNCKDWQYTHSVRKSDCDHIQELKHGLVKKSSYQIYRALGAGAGASHIFNKSVGTYRKGKSIKENVKRLQIGQPLIPVG